MAYDDARFRELLESAPDAVLEVNREGVVVLVNRAAESLFGYSREELLGQSVETLVPTDLRSNHVDHRKRYEAHPAVRPMGIGLELEARRKDGSCFPVEISLSPIQFDEEFNVLTIVRDVSERKRTERELAAKNRELEARNREIERANQMKSEFLSGMSHELRTPLHTIIGFAELLAEQAGGPLSEKQRRFVEHIHDDSLHLLALINDLLDLGKIESGFMTLHRERLDLGQAVEEAVASLEPRAAAKGLTVETSREGRPDIYADRIRLRQILYNLLSNAVKFTPSGGNIRIETRVLESETEVSVVDTGVGISPEEQDSIFSKFHQVGQKQADGEEGTGLGLAITRQLVEQHGGSIRFESEPGKGTRFTFTIPSN
ncbi:MAG: ATP-binding protein [Bryobacteraceae bacterium]|nr:ATP-binding protein [Bryobacteraceae bacterium]